MSFANSTIEEAIVKFRDIIPAYFYTSLLKYTPDDILQANIYKILRLFIIVGGYMLFRRLIMNHQLLRAKQAQYTQEGTHDKVDDLFEVAGSGEAKNDAAVSSGAEAQWGWGQKTRQRVKAQQELYQKLNTPQAVESDDEDIKDLLQD